MWGSDRDLHGRFTSNRMRQGPRSYAWPLALVGLMAALGVIALAFWQI
jgi:hypothetical protein